MERGWALAVAWLMHAACGNGADGAIVVDAAIDAPLAVDATPAVPDARVEPPCPGDVPPALAACTRGRAFADCGGTGPPRLACRVGMAGGECMWFVTSCVADGFIASECASDAVCCVNDWPYTPTGSGRDSFLHPFLYGYGARPWDGERVLSVTVEVDADLGPGSGMFTCEGTPPFSGGQNPCATGAKVKPSSARTGHWLSFDLAPRNDLYGWTVWVELDTTRTPLVARVCTSSFTDARQLMCKLLFEPVCATAGRVTLSTLPADAAGLAGLAMRLDVMIGDLRLRAEL